MLIAAPAPAQDLRIGLAAPLSGPMAPLGAQMLQGAQAYSDERAIDLLAEDDGCTAEGGRTAAQRFVAEKAEIVVGFLCTEAIEAAMPVLTPAGIPVITPAVRTDSLTDLRERTGWPVYRLAPRADAERNAAASILLPRWRQALFAIVDDGTIYGRELAESFRLAAEQAGLKPVFVDTFRPALDNQIGLAGRLRRAGATHVFVGGDRSDIAVLARDAAGLYYQLTIAGGEVLRAAPGEVALADGVLMVGLPEWAEIAEPEVLSKLEAGQVRPEGYALPAYAALQSAFSAVEAGRDTGKGPIEALDARTFETVLGPVAFGEKGDVRRDFHRLFEFRGGDFVEVD